MHLPDDLAPRLSREVYWACAGTTLFLHLCTIGLRVARNGPPTLERATDAARRAFHRVAFWALRVRCRLRSGSAVSRRNSEAEAFSDLMDGKRLRLCRSLLQWMQPVMLLIPFLQLYNHGQDYLLMGGIHQVMFFVSYWMLILCLSFPDLVNARTIYPGASTIFLILAASCSPGVTNLRLLPSLLHILQLPRLMIGIVVCNWPLTLLWNLIHLGAVVTHIIIEDSQPLCADYTLKRLVLREICLTIFMTAVDYGWQRYREIEALREVRAKSFRNELSAAGSLLSVLCDAVVELDAELRISKPSPTLATLLLHSSGQALEGKSLQQFLYTQEDRDAFASRMQVCTAKAFHQWMRDSQGNKIQVEFFHVCFPNHQDLRHLVGIREYGDEAVSGPARLRRDNHAGLTPPRVLMPRSEPPLEVMRSSERFWVSCNAHTFEATGCSEAFAATAAFPCSAGSDLSQWLMAEQSAAFCQHYTEQLALAEVYNDQLLQFQQGGGWTRNIFMDPIVLLDKSKVPDCQCMRGSCFLTYFRPNAVYDEGNQIQAIIEVNDLVKVENFRCQVGAESLAPEQHDGLRHGRGGSSRRPGREHRHSRSTATGRSCSSSSTASTEGSDPGRRKAKQGTRPDRGTPGIFGSVISV